MRAKKSILSVKTGSRMILGKDMQRQRQAALLVGQPLRLPHQLRGDPSAAKLWSDIQGDHIADRPLRGLFPMKNHKAGQDLLFFRKDHARPFGLRKAAHG